MFSSNNLSLPLSNSLHPSSSSSSSSSPSLSSLPHSNSFSSSSSSSLSIFSQNHSLLFNKLSSRYKFSSKSHSNLDPHILNAVRNIGLDSSTSPSSSTLPPSLIPQSSFPSSPSPFILISPPNILHPSPSSSHSSSSTLPLTSSLSSPPSIHSTTNTPSIHLASPLAPPLPRLPRSAPGSSLHLNNPTRPPVSRATRSSHSDTTVSPSTPNHAPSSSSSRLQPPPSPPNAPQSHSSAHPHPQINHSLPAASSSEPTIDYSEVLEDIRNPPPAFTVPSHPPPPGHPPAPLPSDISCGLHGRPNSPPPPYPVHKSDPSSHQPDQGPPDNRTQPQHDLGHNQLFPEELPIDIGEQRNEATGFKTTHRSSWNLNLSLDHRITIWNAHRNLADVTHSSPSLQSPSPPANQAVHQTQSHSQNQQPIWIPIRLVMDNNNLAESSSHSQVAPLASTSQETTDCHVENEASENHSVYSLTDPRPTLGPDYLLPISGCRSSQGTECSVTGYTGKGKQVDRCGTGVARFDKLFVEEPSGGGPRPSRRPPPLPPMRRQPPPSLTRAHRPPPLPPKPRMSTHEASAPPSTPLPASPAVVNEMLRRGSSLRRAPVVPPRRSGTRDEARERDEEARAFNRRSLPVLAEPAGDAWLVDRPSPAAAVAVPVEQEPTDMYGPFTELDLLLLRVERAQDGTSYGDLQVLEELLGGPVQQPVPVDAQALDQVLRAAQVELVARRVDREGKVKQKLSVLEVRCNKCMVCLYQFKPGQIGAILPCSHVFHEGCIREWVYRENKCPLCKRYVVENY